MAEDSFETLSGSIPRVTPLAVANATEDPREFLMLAHVPPENRTVQAHFLAAYGRPVETQRALYFGRCNFRCFGCKEHLDTGAVARYYPAEEVFAWCESALGQGQRIRLLGGDPCMHPRESRMIAEWAQKRGQRIALAHNGSSLRYVKQMLPYLEYAGIDLKGITATQFERISGLTRSRSETMIGTALAVVKTLCDAGVLVDVRQVIPDWVTFEEMQNTASTVAHVSGNRAFLTFRQYQIFDADEPYAPAPIDVLAERAHRISRSFPELFIGINESMTFTILRGGREIYRAASCFAADPQNAATTNCVTAAAS